MMTDKEKLLALLKSWNINYTEVFNNFTQSSQVILEVPVTERRTNLVGYTGFTTEFTFAFTGEFTQVGIWE